MPLLGLNQLLYTVKGTIAYDGAVVAELQRSEKPRPLVTRQGRSCLSNPIQPNDWVWRGSRKGGGIVEISAFQTFLERQTATFKSDTFNVPCRQFRGSRLKNGKFITNG